MILFQLLHRCGRRSAVLCMYWRLLCGFYLNYYTGVTDALQCYVCAGGYCVVLFKLLHRCDRRSAVLCMCWRLLYGFISTIT